MSTSTHFLPPSLQKWQNSFVMVQLRVSGIKILSDKNFNQVKIFQRVLHYMRTKSRRKIHVDAKANSATDITNSERKSTPTQDYKKMLQKRLYELESESMPAT